MKRHSNHCACPRCGSRLPQDPTEMLEAVALEERRNKLLLRGWDRNKQQRQTKEAP